MNRDLHRQVDNDPMSLHSLAIYWVIWDFVEGSVLRFVSFWDLHLNLGCEKNGPLKVSEKKSVYKMLRDKKIILTTKKIIPDRKRDTIQDCNHEKFPQLQNEVGKLYKFLRVS